MGLLIKATPRGLDHTVGDRIFETLVFINFIKGLLISEPLIQIQLSSKTSNPKSKTSELSKHETPEEKKDRKTNL